MPPRVERFWCADDLLFPWSTAGSLVESSLQGLAN